MKQTDIMDTLRELKEMFMAGAISEEEFQSLKMDFLQKQNLIPAGNSAATSSSGVSPFVPKNAGGSIPSRAPSDPFVPKARVFSNDANQGSRGVPVATAKSSSSDQLSAAPTQAIIHKTPPLLQGLEQATSLTPSHGMPASTALEDRQQEFMRLYTEATQLAATQPDSALQRLKSAKSLAPELCDDVFHQWEQYSHYMIQQQREERAAQQKAQAEAPQKAQEQALLQSVAAAHQATLYGVGKHEHEAPLLHGEEGPGKSGESTNPGFDMPRSAHSHPQDDFTDEPTAILLSGVNDLLAEEDFLGAFDLLEHLIPQHPESNKIQILYKMCRQQVEQVYLEKFAGSENMYPVLTCSLQELLTLSGQLDHRAGFLASQMNGATSIEDLVNISGLEEFAVFRLIEKLQQRSLIRFA